MGRPCRRKKWKRSWRMRRRRKTISLGGNDPCTLRLEHVKEDRGGIQPAEFRAHALVFVSIYMTPDHPGADAIAFAQLESSSCSMIFSFNYRSNIFSHCGSSHTS